MEMKKIRVVLFWMLFISGIVVHSLGDVLPIFWGVDVAMEHSGVDPAGMLSFMMIIEYVLPLTAILFVLYGKGKLSAIVNLVLALLIALFNLMHCSELFMDFTCTKLFTLPFVLLVSLLLAVESWRYRQTIRHGV